MKPIDTKTWKEFKVGDLFELTGVKQAKSQKLIPTTDDGIPYVVQSQINNMVSRRVDKQYLLDNDEPVCEGNVIVLGVTLPAVSYQPTEFGASQVITAYNKHLNEGVGLFLAVMLNQQMGRFSYTNKPGLSKYKELMLKLPIQPTLDPDKTYHPNGYIPDWNYMENFMEQINQQAQARLDEYKDGKVDKVEYTPVDTESWQEFKVGDLFKKVDLKRKKVDFQKNSDLSKTKTDEFNLPLVNAKHGNNGIMYYGREEDWEYAEMTIDIVSDGAVSAGNVYPQPNKTGILYNAYLIKPLKKDVTENHLSFLATVIEKYAKQKYSYANKCVWNKLALDKIPLPVDQTGQPDWNYMESFMKQINQQAQTKLNQLEKGSK